MKKIMQEKYQVIPDSDLSPEFLSQFKREADVSKTITHRLQNSNLNSQFTPNFQASSIQIQFPGAHTFCINFRT